MEEKIEAINQEVIVTGKQLPSYDIVTGKPVSPVTIRMKDVVTCEKRWRASNKHLS